MPRTVRCPASCRDERQVSIPEKHARAVAAVLTCVEGRTIRVAELPLDNDAERMDLALMLHEWGALRCFACSSGR